MNTLGYAANNVHYRPSPGEKRQLLNWVSESCQLSAEWSNPGSVQIEVDVVVKAPLDEWKIEHMPTELRSKVDADLRKVVELDRSRKTPRESLRTEQEKNWSEFLGLWTQATASPRYDKKPWKDIEDQLRAANVI